MQILKISEKDLTQEIKSGNQSKIEAAIQKAYQSNNTGIFNALLIYHPEYISNPNILPYFIKILEINANTENGISLFEDFLFNISPETIQQNPKIHHIFYLNNQFMALALLVSNTPENIVTDIINRYKLNIPQSTPIISSNEKVFENPIEYNLQLSDSEKILTEMINLLKEDPNITWDNEQSFSLFLVRLHFKPSDPFMAEVAKYSLSTSNASVFLNIKQISVSKKLKENILNNNSLGVSLAKLLKSEIPNTEIMTEINKKIIEGTNVNMIWDAIKYLIINNKNWNNNFLLRANNTPQQETLRLIINENPNLTSEIFRVILSQNQEIKEQLLSYPMFRVVYIPLLKDINTRQEVLKEYPIEVIEKQKLPYDFRKELEEIKNKEKEKEKKYKDEDFDIETFDLYGSNKNWYKISQSWYTREVAETTKDPKILTDILRMNKNYSASCYAAQNPNTPPEALAEVLRRGNDYLVSYYAAQNPNTPPEALAEVLSKGKDDDVSRNASQNPNTPPKDVIDWMKTTGKIGKEDPKKHIIEYDNKEEEIDEDLEKLKKLISNNKSWYKIASSINELEKTAGWKQNTLLAIIIAVVAILNGVSLKNASKKYNIPEQKLQEAMQKPEILDEAKKINEEINKKETQTNQNNINLDILVDLIIQHEGLIKGQTPFRISHPIMREWNNIHGFEIDKNIVKPKNRENFIFLKNPNDVKPAIKKQLIKYVNNPSRYQLPNNPTIKDALTKFDQTGAKGKMEFIAQKLPSINFNIPLASIIQ